VEIHIDRGSAVPIYLQICQGLREMIVTGKLPEGFRLPPERRLAQALGVNRSTVLAAYRELKADALVDAHVGRGTSVLARPLPSHGDPGVVPLAWRQLFSEVGGALEDPLLRDLLELSERHDVISLSVGLPARELLPLETLRAVNEELLSEVGPAMLLHSPSEGITPFRATLVDLATTRGITCSLPEVIVVSGSQQGLDLVARVLVQPGDAVVVEEPSFFGALQVFRAARARLLGVPVDGDGLRTDALESLLARYRPKLIYTLPTFQNPSGVVMSLERRRQLLELAHHYQIPILEDDPYSELRYEGTPPPSLKALDAHGYVIYLSSFSKVLFPGLRLGWVVAPRPVARQLVLAKQAVDLHSSTLGQWWLDRFVRAGHLARHVVQVRQAYAARRDVMDEALRSFASTSLTWQRPTGGFYFWCRLAEGMSHTRLLARAAERRVSFLPGAACFFAEGGEDHIRLNFTFPGPEEIREGVCRLGEALRTVASSVHQRGSHGGTPPIV